MRFLENVFRGKYFIDEWEDFERIEITFLIKYANKDCVYITLSNKSGITVRKRFTDIIIPSYLKFYGSVQDKNGGLEITYKIDRNSTEVEYRDIYFAERAVYEVNTDVSIDIDKVAKKWCYYLEKNFIFSGSHPLIGFTDLLHSDLIHDMITEIELLKEVKVDE